MQNVSRWECILSDVDDDSTMVVVIEAEYMIDAVTFIEDECEEGGLYFGFRPFVASVLAV